MGVALEWLNKNRENLVNGLLEDERLWELIVLDIENDGDIVVDTPYKRFDEFAKMLASEIMKNPDKKAGVNFLHNLNYDLINLVKSPKFIEETQKANDLDNPSGLFDLLYDNTGKEYNEEDKTLENDVEKRRILKSSSIEKSLLAYEFSLDSKNAHDNFELITFPSLGTFESIENSQQAKALAGLQEKAQEINSTIKYEANIKAEAEAKAKADEEKAKADAEAEAKAKADAEAKAEAEEANKLPYDRELGKLKAYTARIETEHVELHTKLTTLIVEVEKLKADNPENNRDLITILSSTNVLLETGKKGVDAYTKVANDMKGKPSRGLQALGVLMMAIGAIVAVVGVVLAATGVAFGAGLATGAIGSLTAAGGVGLFAKGSQRDKSKDEVTKRMDDVAKEAIPDANEGPKPGQN